MLSLRHASRRSVSILVRQRPRPQLVNFHHHPSLSALTSQSLQSSRETTQIRYFSTTNASNSKKEEEQPQQKTEQPQESLKDTVNRLKGKSSSGSETTGDSSDSNTSGDILRRSAQFCASFSEEVGKTWKELIQSGQPKSINKKIHPVATPGGDAPYTGPVEIMVIDPSEHLTAWERMQKRLTAAPIIQEVLSRSHEVYEKSGAREVKRKIDDLKHDAAEAWETSQNPWVYRASSVYDTLTAETPETVAVRELRVLDPDFTLDDWRQDVVAHTLPQIMEWFLEGKINQLKPWLGEGVFKRLAAEITARQQEGVQIDTHVLGIMNSEILACEPDEVEKGSPIIILYFTCQQINCVRKKNGGEIVEGSEDDIRANSYVVAFQREYNAEEGELNWKIVDFRFNGAMALMF